MGHLIYNFPYTPGLTILFAFWPFVTAFFIIYGQSSDGRPHHLKEVLYYSWVTYLNVGNPKEIYLKTSRNQNFLIKFLAPLLGLLSLQYLLSQLVNIKNLTHSLKLSFNRIQVFLIESSRIALRRILIPDNRRSSFQRSLISQPFKKTSTSIEY